MQKIPLVDLGLQTDSIKAEIQSAFNRVLEHKQFVLGPEVEIFESQFAHFCQVQHAIGVSTGTAALKIALKVCGVEPGDQVVTVAHTFFATAEAISLLGAVPVFVDINENTYTMNVDQVEQLLKNDVRKKIKAILPVHLYGYAADMVALKELAINYSVRLIEDSCQAHGATIQGRLTGGLGDIAAFSFYPAKNLGAFGDAGAVTTNDGELMNRVKILRHHGRSSKYEHQEVGFSDAMDGLQAAVLQVKLKKLEAWTVRRQEIASQYNEQLESVDLIRPICEEGYQHSYHCYVVRVKNRDSTLKYLNDNGIGAAVHYPRPLHRQPAYKSHYAQLSLPVTERICDEIMSLPIFPEMTVEQVNYVCAALKRCL